MSSRREQRAVRMLVLWCPDWPVVAACAAAGVAADRPAAVFAANRVRACSAVARGNGVRRGMRRRDAQSRCPDIAVLDWDPGRDARLFEPVVAAVEELVVGVEVVRPGVVAVPADGAVTYFGGENELVERLLEHVSVTTDVECRVGVADGLFGAQLAAHRDVLIERGGTAQFLAPLPITELDQADVDRTALVELLHRLGIRTLGEFAALRARDVTTRFGEAGMAAHHLARGVDERPPGRRKPPPELTITEEFDPPLDRVDAAAFAARTAAAEFHNGLSAHGIACTVLGITAVTEQGEQLTRTWRCGEPLTPQGVADRVRWQFEGWLHTADGSKPTAGVVRLYLAPEETVQGRSLQLGLWQGGDSDSEHTPEADNADRALVRVQGLLGPDAACTAVLDGGRAPGERVRLVAWGERRDASDSTGAPWPGRLPAPSPATVFEHPPRATVTDASGAELALTERLRLSAAPCYVATSGNASRRVSMWAGPWPVSARWWEPDGQGELARIQVVLAADTDTPETALLLCWQKERNGQYLNGRWVAEGEYD